jgi:hypothetical protein
VGGELHEVTWESRERFDTGQAYSADGMNGPYFYKRAYDPTNAEGLAHEVSWNNFVGALLAERGNLTIVVPRGVYDVETQTAIFEWIGGTPLTDDDVDLAMPELMAVPEELDNLGVDLAWDPEGRDVGAWLGERLLQFAERWDDFNDGQAPISPGVERLTMGDYLELLEPGLVHGDYKPTENLLRIAGTGKIALLDAEFGAAPFRPSWHKPRHFDSAFLAHLLACQFDRPDLSEVVLDHFDGDDRRGIDLLVLERTLAMYTHFVIGNGQPADARRKRPQPYQELVDKTLTNLLTP